MTISSFTKELRSRNSLLYYSGLIHFILLLIFFLAYFFDSREILGINPWIKPMKFAISIAIYTWTFGWILYYLPNSRKFIKIISWAICLSMFVEMIVIGLQSFRGTTSHYNFETAFDALAFSAMGIMILVNTIAIVLSFIWFLIKKPDLPFSYLLSIRLAFIVFIIGNIIGGFMIGNGAHSIGGADGGEGIPFMNWSKEHGDLRIAHFLGLHSIQIIPLFAYLISSYTKPKVQTLLIIIFTAVFSTVFIGLYYQASQGMALFN